MYLIDDLPTHPKILKAGERLGKHGVSQALALYVSAIAYARKHMTDGLVPFAFIEQLSATTAANVLASKPVGLFRLVRGGYEIHDFHDFNRSAKEEKDFRRKERERVATWRARQSERKS